MWFLLLLQLLGVVYFVYMFLVLHYTDYKTPGWEWFWDLPDENSDNWLSRWTARYDALAMLITGILVMAGVVGISRFIVWCLILLHDVIKNLI